MLAIRRFQSIFTLLTAAVLLLPACQSSAPATGDSIGTITREQDLVEQGAGPEALQPVDGTNPLFEGDTLKVSEGGEGLLDFGDKLVVRLFNDSQVGLVSTSAPGTPLGVRLFLERGGFTGRLDEAGGQAVFETPGGANITVLGTQFFVVYNSLQQMSTIGNYDGQVQLDTAAGIVPLQSGHYVDWPSGQMPGQQVPIPITIGQFEQWARQAQSPYAAVERMRITSQPAIHTPFLVVALLSTTTPAVVAADPPVAVIRSPFQTDFPGGLIHERQKESPHRRPDPGGEYLRQQRGGHRARG